MRIVKKLMQEEEIVKYVNIVMAAYPGAVEATQQTQERLISVFAHNMSNEPSINYYGLWEDDNLLGCMRIHDFEMNLFSKIIPIGGVGQVAVDLLHKKERVAKQLIDYFYEIFLEKNVHIVALYPFRPDFYKKMGFGYGPIMHQYFIEPSSFPKGPTKQHIKYCNAQHQQQLADCYNRIARKKHGMFLKTTSELSTIFKNPQNYIIAVAKDETVEGYVVFSFKRQSDSNFMLNNLVIKEFIYETPEALLELSTFINSQADQVQRIEWNTQDNNIHFFLGDVRNGSNHLIPSVYHASSIAGIGLMYRIINIKGFLQELKTHNFNNSHLTVKLTVSDSLIAENNQSFMLKVVEGYLEILEMESYDVEMLIDIAELSSLMMGVVTVQELFMLGKVKLSDKRYLQALHKLFFVHEKPMCMTAF